MSVNYPRLKLLTISAIVSVLNIGLLTETVRAQPSNNRSQGLHSVSSQSTARLNSRNPYLIANSVGGLASWYGPGFHGRLTASGEVYNQNALTAAHPDLKFGTKVKVTNLRNGRSVVVRINDRGPYAGGRVIDLSAAAARSLGMIKSGVASVRVTVLGR